MGQALSDRIVDSPIFFPSPPPSYNEDTPGLVLVHSKEHGVEVPIFVTWPRKRRNAVQEKLTESCVLYFHANACDIGHVRERVQEFATETNWVFVCFEFPGYGLNSDTPTTQEGIGLHSVIALSYVMQVLKFPYEKIFFFGRSIGCGPAAYLAKSLALRNKLIGGLILQSPYTSISNLAEDYVPFSSRLIKKAWDVEAVLSESGGCAFPLCVIHGEKDTVIAASHGYEIYRRASLPKWLKIGYFPREADHQDFDFDILILVLRETDLLRKELRRQLQGVKPSNHHRPNNISWKKVKPPSPRSKCQMVSNCLR